MQGYASDGGSLESRVEGVRWEERERESEDGQGRISRRSCIEAAGTPASQVYVSGQCGRQHNVDARRYLNGDAGTMLYCLLSFIVFGKCCFERNQTRE
jgi:hypothetical protein